MKLAALSPEPNEAADHAPIQWIPGHLCFAQLAELPAELPPEEFAAYAELTLEGSSPFPVEQLAWGFWPDQANHQMLLAAVPRFRLEQEGIEVRSDAAHVFAGFIAACHLEAEQSIVRFIEIAGSMTALRLEPGKRLPQAIRSVPLPEEPDETAYTFAREQALRSLPGGLEGAQVEDGYWTLGLVEHDKDHGWRWTIQRNEEDQLLIHPDLHGDEWWQVDLRDAETQAIIRREQRMAGYVTIAALAGGGVFVLLIVLQLMLWGLSAWNSTRQDRIAEQMVQVDRISQQQLLTERLQSSSEAGLRPFRMLELINTVRPQAVYFERVASKGDDTLQITGRATAVGPVNEYQELLADLPFISSVKSDPTSDASGADFRLTVVFSSVPNLAEAEGASLADSQE